MKNYFSTVVEYVKNLFPGRAAVVVPSDNPKLDAEVLSSLATDLFYTNTPGGGRDWYCFTRVCDMPIAKYILASNGIDPAKYGRRFLCNPTPMFRVRMSELHNNLSARDFVERVMDVDAGKMDMVRVNTRIAEIRQKLK